jgi:hypothetical protein
MKCHPYNIRYEKCATCPELGKCAVFDNLSSKQLDAYMEFILDHIHRYPDKYTLGVVMAENKTPNNILLLDAAPPKDRWGTLADINNMSDAEKLSLKDKHIYQVTKKYQVRYKVELKAVPLDNDEAVTTPAPKRKTRQ